MAPVRREQDPRPAHWGAIALAGLILAAAAGTTHVSPVSTISAILVTGAAAVLALYLPARHAAAAAGLGTFIGVATAVFGFDATAVEALWSGGFAAASSAFAIAMVGRLRPRTSDAKADQRTLDARSPSEPVLLELARQTFADFDRCNVETLLESLIEALDCDSITIWRNTDDGLLTAQLEYWAGTVPERGETIVWNRAPSVAGLFSTGRRHVFQDVEALPSPDRAGYRRTGVSAAIEAPVHVNERWVGHVSMSCQLGSRTWEDREIDAVTAVAEMVSSVWTRQAAVEQMKRVAVQRDRSLNIQRALSEAARLIFESDDEQLGRILEVILSSLDGRIAYFMTLRRHEDHGTGLVPNVSRVATGAIVPPHLDSGNMISVPDHYLPLLNGEPLMISDMDRFDATVRRWYAETLPQTAAELVFPVMNGATVVGILGLTSNTVRSWEAAEIRTLSAIAQMLGVARTRADARRGLEDIVKAKDLFIASVSHQLRTPMAVVMGLSSELGARWSDFSQDEVMEFIDLISRESREVSHIIEDLLVAARASADSITVLPEVIRLDEIVSDAIHSMSAETTHRLVSIDLSPVSTMADPLRIRQIVRNLVTNGHRHGGHQIFIRVGERKGAAVLEVSDDGEGIPDERRDRIFEAYEVGESDGWTATMGLGLTVSRQLARLMGGDVTYEHDPMPTFRLSLPVGAAIDASNNVRSIGNPSSRLTA